LPEFFFFPLVFFSFFFFVLFCFDFFFFFFLFVHNKQNTNIHSTINHQQHEPSTHKQASIGLLSSLLVFEEFFYFFAFEGH